MSLNKVFFHYLALCLVFFLPVYVVAQVTTATSGSKTMGQGRIIMDIQDYPTIFELNKDETQEFIHIEGETKIVSKIRLLDVRHFRETNLWFSKKAEPANYYRAEVDLDINGNLVTVVARPYQSPVVVNGLRIYIEVTKPWATKADFAALKNVEREVRLAVRSASEPWGPTEMLFPIKNYRWRSNTYQNTWLSLVPYNTVYYHRGEDFGAIPDKLDVIAPFDGVITQSPLPDGDGKSNTIAITNKYGITCKLAHMNTESIDAKMVTGKKVKAGEVIGKTGMTWGGKKAQKTDHHFHFDFWYGDFRISAFPYVMDAYFRDYKDSVLAIAGGYQYAKAGDEVVLDASRSLTQTGEKPVAYEWIVKDGQRITGDVVKLKYNAPGLYSEELLVKMADGSVDRDFVQVRIYGNQDTGRNLVKGHAYYYPLRGICSGAPVTFRSRISGTDEPVHIDFGDGVGAVIKDEIVHAYRSPGRYVVVLSTKGLRKDPFNLKMEVIVE
jgi:murein DD-endopeptidase MepM/ murein hydrolase activator NlpD